MKHAKRILLLTLALVFFLSGLSLAGEFKYKVKKVHVGGDVTPAQAYEKIKKDPKHTFLVDVRTRAEYQLIGHPKGAYLVPLKFWSGKLEEKKYGMAKNPNFGKDLLAQFNPKTDTLLFMCRSGGRSCDASNAAVKAGWSESKVFNVMGGFEGGKVKDKKSPNYGQRKCNGWRIEGLPWAYKINKKLVYKADLCK